MNTQLPIYVLIDTSGSMFGQPMLSVRECMVNSINHFKNQDFAGKLMQLSLITYADEAVLAVKKKPLEQIVLPHMVGMGKTCMGKAVEMLCNELERNAEGADRTPVVVICTDGVPTDETAEAVEHLRSLRPNIGLMVAVAAGAKADVGALCGMQDVTLRLQDNQPEAIKQAYSWLRQAVQQLADARERNEEVSAYNIIESVKKTEEDVDLMGVEVNC